MIFRGFLVAAALGVTAAGARAQDTTAHPPPRPPVLQPPPGRDTTIRPLAPPGPPDTTRRDTTADTLPAYLPPYPRAVPPGPLPTGERYTFTADSFAFSDALTLADLLVHVPGVFVARGGYWGQSETVFYGGRGAYGLEIYWDGVPYLPLGRDSVYVDAGRIPLAPVERVEVVVLPGTLRVYLVSARQRSTVASTLVGVGTGDMNIAQYRAGFAKRWRNGVGLSLLADWDNLNGSAGTSTTAFNSVDLWLDAVYIPTPRAGASYQILSSTWSRSGETGLVDPWKYKRQDGILRLFFAARDDGLGPRFDLTLASATASRDSAVGERGLRQARVALSDQWARASASVGATFASERVPLQLEAQGAWIPLRPLTLAADARLDRYEKDRRGHRVHFAAGLALPLGLSIHGDLVQAREIGSPALSNDSLQSAADASVAIRWAVKPLTIEGGVARRGAFDAIGDPKGLSTIGGIGPTPRTTYITTHASLRPLPGLELSGWFFDPRQGGGDFEPPYHARLSATFYSKFWRVYKSGVFALRGEVAYESWSRALAGLDPSATSQQFLGGASFLETNIELRIVGVTAFWMMRNNNATKAKYVPGLEYPRHPQFFGVRWVFTN
ncbi:MAG TPA: Plug domain-containing protein [Gemmatimonadales bacterium]|nr:Plug domain-containing protein [Gemmatimonadales bacterium]